MPKRLLLPAAVALLSAAGGSGCSEPASAQRPNIVVIVADDLGWADVGYRGSTIATPNIDRLAAEGVRFERFYAQPWCSPTRAAFLTGRFPARFAWDVPATNEPAGSGIDPHEHTLPERFQDAGYTTALIGKWHQGALAESHPNENGFDYFYGLIGGYIGYYSKTGNRGLHDWQRNGEQLLEPGYATDLLGKDAARFVRERDRSRPFFMMLSFNAPHFPQEAPKAAVERYRSDPSCRKSKVRCRYMAQVEIMDREIGGLFETLESEGIRDETLIVLFSDNGGFPGFGASNLPLRGEKASVYEGGVRVVALASWPGVLAGGTQSRQRMQVADLYATLEAAAGLPASEHAQASTNLWPAITANREVAREPFLFMVHGPEPGPDQPHDRAILTDSWKLALTEPATESEAHAVVELFDIVADPNEESDLAADRPRVVRDLRALLDELVHAASAAPESEVPHNRR